MTATSSEYLDLRKGHNYLRYLLGIAIESGAVGLIIALGFCIAAVGIWVF